MWRQRMVSCNLPIKVAPISGKARRALISRTILQAVMA